jgi:hypothetical protein
MRLAPGISFILWIALIFQSCAPKGTPVSVLGTPKFVPQSQPDSVIEAGIGQDPSTGGIFLQWYPDPGAAGYRVFRTDSTGATGTPLNFTIVADTKDTSIVDGIAITTGVRYYYNLRAYTTDGALSNASDTISYGLLARPVLAYPGQNSSVSGSGLTFTWNDFTGGGYTVIRVKDITVVPAGVVWVSHRHQINTGGQFSWPFNFDSTATSSLVSGHSYQWRVDRFSLDGTGRPYEGSRSAWGTFTVK